MNSSISDTNSSNPCKTFSCQVLTCVQIDAFIEHKYLLRDSQMLSIAEQDLQTAVCAFFKYSIFFHKCSEFHLQGPPSL